jgi:DNA-binding transcriptional LysR family regulator
MQSLNWDDLRLFLSVARAGRLVSAAKRLALDHSTIARRISALETGLGVRLLDRSPRGVLLTDAGRALMAHAERMEAEAIGASSLVRDADAQLSGTVRLATPEAFGAWFLAPRLSEFYARHPGIELELVPDTRQVSLSRREADLMVTLTRPRRGRLVTRKLSDYSLGLYASCNYMAENPGVECIDDLSTRPLIWYIDDLIDMPELRFLDSVVANARTVFRSSSITAQHNAIASGLGLGLLHKFVAGQDERLVSVLPEAIHIERTYWLAIHADNQRLPRVRAVADFVIGIVREAKSLF